MLYVLSSSGCYKIYFDYTATGIYITPMDLISGMVPNYQQIVCVGDITEDDYTAYPRYFYLWVLLHENN